MFLTTLYIIVFCRRCKVNDLVQNCLDLKLRSLIYNERLIVWHFGIEIIFQGNAKSSSREEKEKKEYTWNQWDLFYFNGKLFSAGHYLT